MTRHQHPKFKILNKKEKAEIEKTLNQQFGIKKIEGSILQRGAERLFLYQGNLNVKEIQELEKTLPIERIGVYFAKLIPGQDQIRLSIEGTQIFKNQITKNIFELNKEQAKEWMHGRELLIKTGKKDFLIMKYKDDFIGCGKASEEKITNFIPKNRRLKEKN